MSKYHLVPITLRQAYEFTTKNHRHNIGTQGHKFSIGLSNSDGDLIGVATCGRPIARNNDDGKTAEITRVCVLDDYINANSMLYGACCRACKAMGYESVITYTLLTESGSSLLASGFKNEGEVKVKKNGWDSPSRRIIVSDISLTPKQRWRRVL